MIDWIWTHPYAAAAVAILVIFAAVCLLIGMDWLRERLDGEPDTSPESGAPEGAPPRVRMPRFR